MCEVSEIVDVKKVVSDLKNNPVFRMSLASKELFHSNMLAWFLESNDSEDPLLSDIAKELAKLFMPDYTVLTVLRERKHFDLLVVLFPTKDYNDFIKNSLTEIENVFQNSGSGDKNLLNKLQKYCRFAVVENKFKSIPNKRQLNEYKNKAKITFGTKESKIEMTDKNTTYYLLAPQVSLDHFEECDSWETTISWNKISKTLSEALKTKEKSDPFTAKFIEYYADFLEDMLKLTTDIEEKLKLPNDLAFPKREDITELRKIRIHDFYEKLWFSVLLSKIETVENVKKGSGYSNSSGLVEFQIKNDHHVVYGVQIQQSQFRLFVVPTGKCKREYSDKEIKDCCYGVLEIMKEKLGTSLDFSPKKKNPKDLHCYGEFKYKFIPLEKDISIEKLTEMINCALDAISQSPLKNLTAKAEEEK